MTWANPQANRKFYHISRHAELVVVKDRDVVSFFPDTILLDGTQGMQVYRNEPVGSIPPDFLMYSSPFNGAAPQMNATERYLLWGRLAGQDLVSGWRWTPYVTSRDVDEIEIKPLREVIAPRVTFDRTSNMLHLWFWTNVNQGYTGDDYDEAEIVPIGTENFWEHNDTFDPPSIPTKRVLCYSVGQFGHYWVTGGHLDYPGLSFDDSTFDLVPIFTLTRIINPGLYN